MRKIKVKLLTYFASTFYKHITIYFTKNAKLSQIVTLYFVL